MESPIVRLTPTLFSIRYGFAPGHGKSLLTPVTPLPYILPLLSDGDASSWKARNDIEEYQRDLLHSYTTRMLRELDAITERDLDHSTLLNPILPCLRRSQWETSENMIGGKDAKAYVSDGPSLGREEDVIWLAENDLVWEELVPILRLASWIIIKLSKTPWFDAMMMSERIEVSTHRLKADTLLNHLHEGLDQMQNELTQIKLRPLKTVIKGEAEALMHFLISKILLPRMKLCFVSETINPLSGQPYPRQRESGKRVFGSCSHDKGRIIIFISYQQIAPLLNLHLNDAERLAERFGCATIIAHEFMHALNKAKVHYYDPVNGSNPQQDFEPYFEDEIEAELGYSSISNFFGGYAEGFTKFIPVYNAPQMGFFLTSFPGLSAGNTQPTLKCLSKSNPSIHLSIPLPVTYYEVLNSNQFWEQQVTAFGMIKAPVFMGGATFAQPHGWKVIQEDEERFAKQRRISLYESAAYETPYARHESAVSEIHMNKVITYYLSIEDLKEKTREAMDQSEWLIKSMSNPYEGFSSDVSSMIDALEELLKLHEGIIEFIPTMDKHAGEAALHHHATPDGRSAARTFHADFLRFVDSLILTEIPESEVGCQKILARLEDLGKTVPFLDATEDSASDEEPKEVQMMRKIHEAFIQASESDDADQSPCRKLCDEVLGSLACSLYSQAQARVFKSRLHRIGIYEEIALIRRASETFSLIHDGTIPVSYPLWDEEEISNLEEHVYEWMPIYERMLRLRGQPEESVDSEICYTWG
ncbi:hypothetical protein DSL72_009023 [Monilinia vaccinii-corymbosi]|uniref:Uncharacterized protein n=1 Tax=Monilinia vaccinii-corymbosi TaxID=61207 RepID=A0A8A3PN74_9HELO|nr:hypothetical protein DSL72_009023 [Monilinia vaccinii-corymbosi]